MGRDLPCGGTRCMLRYFNPLSPHGERRDVRQAQRACSISIHSPRMWRDGCAGVIDLIKIRFQSTLPAWGETSNATAKLMTMKFQSTLPAWGETCPARGWWGQPELFQSTLPAWGETIAGDSTFSGRPEFQSTLPAWGETCAPFTERSPYEHFNPLSPHGERLKALID